MTITEIINKIVQKADINALEYTVQERLDDVNDYYRQYIELAAQIGSKEPASESEVVSETFSVVPGSNVFTRTIPDVAIVRVDFEPDGATTYCRITEDYGRGIDMRCRACGVVFFADEKRIFVEEGRTGTIRVTYAYGPIYTFDNSDYISSNPPSPDFLPEVFHPLLWLKPATVQALYYKKDRGPALQAQLSALEQLFYNHYSRNSAVDSRIETDERGITRR